MMGTARGRARALSRCEILMVYGLREGLSFCEVGGRHLFIDIFRARYFCLSEELEADFRQLRTAEIAGVTASSRRLTDAGILTCGGTPTTLAGIDTPEAVGSSILDAIDRDLSLLHLPEMAMRLIAASFLLKRQRLASCLHRLSKVKHARRRGLTSDRREMAKAVTALERLRLIATAEDRCLPRSIALAHHLFARGCDCQFVIGVKLGPFAAHSWVQAGAEALNDRPENIRDFKPIFVI